MKITCAEAIPLRLPLRKPMAMGGRRYEVVETVLVRLETTGRHAGWGEASVAPFLTGETTASILAAVPMLAEHLVGRDARDFAILGEVLHRAIVGNAAAKAALDMALHDAVARENGSPLYRLLGGRTEEQFDCLVLVGNSDPERDLAEIADRARAGFRCFKLKVANGDLDAEAETLIEMRKRLGTKALVSADANTNWSAADGMRFARLVECASPDFLEQPVASDDLDGMRRIMRASSVPVGADESIHDVADIRHLIETGAAAGGSFKVMKLEGITRCLAAIRLCRALGGEVNLSGKLGEGSIANAATLAVAAATGRPSWGLSITNHYLADDVVHDPIVIHDGTVRVLDGPGLGVEIDEARVRRFEAQPGKTTRIHKKSEVAGAATS
jgi:L-alanine-DL-glutamate epimerase-like enolase superfamily enzyme